MGVLPCMLCGFFATVKISMSLECVILTSRDLVFIIFFFLTNCIPLTFTRDYFVTYLALPVYIYQHPLLFV